MNSFKIVLLAGVIVGLSGCSQPVASPYASPEVAAWAETCLISSCAGDFVKFNENPAKLVSGGGLRGPYPIESLQYDINYLKESGRLGEIVGFVSLHGDPQVYMATMQEYADRK